MGGQKGIALFYQYLSELLPVTIISTKNNDVPSKLNAEFLPVLSNSRLRYINPFLFSRIKKLISKNNSTHFIIEHPYYGWLGILLKKFTGIKLVVHSHNIEAVRFKSTGKWWWRILWNYEKMVHRKADINFFISDNDRAFAVKEFKLNPACCFTITYGCEISNYPSAEEKKQAKQQLQRAHGIREDEHILFFNGTLDYKPNLDAVDIILQELTPRLMKNASFRYKIIICGKNLPAAYQQLESWSGKNIFYAGFVDDIGLYFKGVDLFINPVTDGGGIKTKLVEALGNNVSCISTANGSIGVSPDITGKKLQIVPDGDWERFTNAIFEANTTENIPQTFFNHFYWGYIANKASEIISIYNIETLK